MDFTKLEGTLPTILSFNVHAEFFMLPCYQAR